jgi:PAS domain S-box-containing protein
LGVPLVNQGVVAGLIAITRQQPGSFDEQAEQAAFAFANQMAIALSNAHLYAQAEYRNERLSLLNRVSISLAQSLDSENILEIGLREIALAMNVGHARAFVFERDLQIARTIVVYPRGDTPPDEIISLVDSPIFHEIRQTVAPIIYEDTSRLAPDSPVALELAPRQARAYAMIPMTVGGQVIGAYELEIYDAPRYFNPEQIELAIIIANQSAIAVQNTNLLEQTLVRTRELETMLEAAQATSLTLSLEETFRNVVELMLHALEMNDCALMIWDNVENVLEVQLDLNRFDDPERVLPVGSKYDLKHYPAKRRAVEEREIIVIRADDNEADPTEVNELRRSADTFRVLIPLVMRDQAIGLIQTDVQAPHRIFAHREIRLAQALSAQAAIAIQNARLSTETAALVEEGFIINNLSQAIASKLEIEDMIAIVRDQVARVTDAEEIYLALYDAQTETISFPMAVRQGEDLNIPNRQLNTDEVSFIVKHKRSLTLGGGNWSSDDMRRNLGIANGEGDIKSYLGVPVKSGDQVIGVLALIDRRNTRAFGINDERLLTTVGTQLGAGIQNARLFNQVSTFAEDLSRLVQERTQDLQQERDRIDTLYRITSELARTLDMERIVRRGLEMIVGAVNADDGVIMLIDPLSDDLFTRATYLTDGPPTQPHPAHDLAAWLMENDRSIVVNDLHHTDFWDAQASGADGYRSAMAVLLESGDDPQGVLVVLGKQLGAFSETQLKLVSAAATQVASAINNADLYHLIRDQAERLGLLLRTEQEEAEKNQAIVEGIADGVMLADAEGIIILFNSAAERVLALPRDNVIGQQLFKLTGLFGGLGTEWAQAIQEWELNPQEHPAGEFLEARLDLGKRVVNVHLSPVHIGERFLGTVSVFRDITKEVEVDRTKSQFVSNVSHELRTPMTSIKGFAELLLMGVAGQLSDQQRGLMQKIKSNADRMSQLVNDLLNISKIDAGERLNLELIEVGPIVENVIGTVQSKSHNERKEMKVTVDIAPLLPPIKADEQKITQVVSNIIENAFNYTPPGGSIDVRVHQDNDRVVIAVKDSGIGIPDEFRSRIWQRFERYDEHALVMDVPGTGLGLSIAKEFIEMHRGDIWFDSELNKGTTFYISLPVDQPDEFAQGSD